MSLDDQVAIWIKWIREILVEFAAGLKSAAANIFGGGKLLPLTAMLVTFIIGWLITRYTLFPTEEYDWKGAIAQAITGSNSKSTKKPTSAAKLAVAAANDKYMVFLLSNIGTLKIVLVWACVVLISIAIWRLASLLVLAGILSGESIATIEAGYVDPALSFVFDARVYTTTFACLAASMAINLVLVLAVFKPSKGNKLTRDASPDARYFLNLALGATAIVFLIGFAFAFALASEAGEIHSVSKAD